MKILQICKKFPYPLKDGESLAINSLGKSLKTLGCEMTLLAMNTSKHFFDLKKLPEEYNQYQKIHTVPVDNRIKPFQAFLNLFSTESYHVCRFVSNEFKEKLSSLLQQQSFDVIQLETLYLAPYIPLIRKYSDAIISMRAHNVEHEIWERIVQHTLSKPKRWYLQHLTSKLKRYETEQLQKYDVLLPITERDLKKFRQLGFQKKAVVIPIGIDVLDYQPAYESFSGDISLSFIGSLDWMPNQEGLIWFLDKVWGRLSKRFPDLKLHIAGRNTPDWIINKKIKNVQFHGEVPDAVDFINKHSIMLVPLRSGSGMRAKILEGMALGKVVVSTKLGLEGIRAKDKEQVLIAENVEEFIQAFNFCYQQNGKLESMGRSAQEFVSNHYDHLGIAKKLIRTYESIMVEAI